MSNKNRCPECDSEEFISELNQYDVYEFDENKFIVTKTHIIDEYAILCRECQTEIDEDLSIKKKRIILKNIQE